MGESRECRDKPVGGLISIHGKSFKNPGSSSEGLALRLRSYELGMARTHRITQVRATLRCNTLLLLGCICMWTVLLELQYESEFESASNGARV